MGTTRGLWDTIGADRSFLLAILALAFVYFHQLGRLYMLLLLPEKASCDFEILCICPGLIQKLPAPAAT